jgi:hypothetical protein
VSFICLSLKHFVELLPCTLPVAFNLPGQRLIGVKLSCANPRERWTRYVESIELSCMTKPFNSRCIKLDGTSPKSNARTCLLLWRRDTQPSVTRPSLALLRCAVQTARTRRTAQPTSRPCLILLGVCRGSSTTASLGPVSSHRLVLPSSLGVATGEKWEKTELTPLKWDGSVRSILDQWFRPESKRILRGGFNPSSACLGNNHPQN